MDPRERSGPRRSGLGGPGGGTVRFRCTFHNTIYDVLRARGWREVETETDWDVAWIDTGWLREAMHATWRKRGDTGFWQFDRPEAAVQYRLPERFAGLF